MGNSDLICFRCNGELVLIQSVESIEFFKCESCKREFARENRNELTDRWGSPISIALYSIIFEKEPISEEHIDFTAHELIEQFNDNIEEFINEISIELINPKQKVSEILNMLGNEKIARDYLKRLVVKLKSLTAYNTR